MSDIPNGSRVFLDTNVLIYAISEHPRFGLWSDELLSRIQLKEVQGYVSLIVLNELTHKLIIGEVAQKVGLKPSQVVRYLKEHHEVLAALDAYEMISEIESNYGLVILGLTLQTMKLARNLMQAHQLLSNDALHLATMQEANIQDIATNDADFETIESITVWKPKQFCV